jgi:5-methylcytosine-specific restriction endonuclease McrA
MMLNKSVLLLNQNYEPLTVCNVKKAIILIFLEKAEVIENDTVFIHSVSSQMHLPVVIRLKRFARAPEKKIILNRKNLLIRDNHSCQYCGRKTQPLTVDHITPRQFGGRDTWENLVIACLPCNNRKGNRTPEQAAMRLISRPKRPNHFFYFQHFIGLRDERWRPYLFMK